MSNFQDHEPSLMREPLLPSDLTLGERKAIGHAADLAFGFGDEPHTDHNLTSVDAPIRQQISVPTIGELNPNVLRVRTPRMSLEQFRAEQANKHQSGL
ncbi:MAG: hypothetical protein JWN26_845 [Candidatus Saccharibacteria bacterium]|nr:hypothetical protein [Candidatus Saccharibacteria bacterium]